MMKKSNEKVASLKQTIMKQKKFFEDYLFQRFKGQDNFLKWNYIFLIM